MQCELRGTRGPYCDAHQLVCDAASAAPVSLEQSIRDEAGDDPELAANLVAEHRAGIDWQQR